MPDQKQEEQWRQADDEVRKNLPPGVKLVRTLRGHTGEIGRIAWSPDGKMLASPSKDKTIRLWDATTGGLLHTLRGHEGGVNSVAFDQTSRTLASGSDDGTVKLWDTANGRRLPVLKGGNSAVHSVAFNRTGSILAGGCADGAIKLWAPAGGRLIRTLEEHNQAVYAVAFDPAGTVLASGSKDRKIKFWEPPGGKMIRTMPGHQGAVYGTVFHPDGRTLASASGDKTVKIWASVNGKLLHTLEAHTDYVSCVIFLAGGRLIASKGWDDSICISDIETRTCLAVIPEPSGDTWWPGLASHPFLPHFAAVGSNPNARENDRLIHIYELNVNRLFAQPAKSSVNYTSAKIVLVGDSGVGKTGLGWRLAHDEYKEHSSTHGRQFWLLNQLTKRRQLDDAQCEAILWDLAGQPDYRLIHSLFLDDADLALVLFDPCHDDDPLKGIEFWLKRLKAGTSDAGTPVVLVAARSDRGTPRLSREELRAFCERRGIKVWLPTSAKAGEGIEELIGHMKSLISWEDKPATVTTETFKRIKDFVLKMKEASGDQQVILTPEDLRRRLIGSDSKWKFTEDEMLTAVGHLENHGYVTRLKTSRGEVRFLLAPELLNNLAASFVLQARRNERDLGTLEEDHLLKGKYNFPELAMLGDADKDILTDSAAVLFLKHNICFRETDPLTNRAYLVFPELINLKKPLTEDSVLTEDGMAYTVTGSVENVYASLVVLMGYTQTFSRTNQWKNQARYEVGQGFACGFRQEDDRAGELDFVLYFGANTPAPMRMLFQSLFENFLSRRNLTVRRFEPAVCSQKHAINRAVVRERMSKGAGFAFCPECGEKVLLPKTGEPIQLPEAEAKKVEENRREADRRSRFEQVLFRLKTHATELNPVPPECFVSYAWGEREHERWVENSLATDLQKAGIAVVLDKWENTRIGASIPRFIERAAQSKYVIIVGTPQYREKYDNKNPERGYAVAAEGDLIGKRMLGTEAGKENVLPVLLAGTEESAFPPLLQGRVYADFRRRESYFDVALELLLSLYGIKSVDPVAIELRGSLQTTR